MDNITCNELWKDWMNANPESQSVLDSKERISNYSKNDWATMSEEATAVTKMLGQLVIDNILVESNTAEEAFDELIRHCNDWFFTTNKNFVLTVAMLCKSEKKFEMFFDRFQPGLTNYMSRLLMVYLHKLPD